ncbi:hypothetical protein ON010_g14408 [Phytophthora cinnamomi]|nr:hypothetical protein ON010_g14408 [Phytophthora cinnamomi]
MTKNQVHRVQIKFRGGKNDQAGVGVERSLTTTTTAWCCPVRAVWFLVKHHHDPDELLCKISGSEFLQASDVSMWIKAAASATGQDPSNFSTHSLCIGGATALFAAGVDSLPIKLFGRWRSSAFERYTRINEQVTSSMSNQMVGMGFNSSLHRHSLQGQPPRQPV